MTSEGEKTLKQGHPMKKERKSDKLYLHKSILWKN